MGRWLRVLASGALLAVAAPSGAGAVCVGNCNLDLAVTIDEVQRCVNLFLSPLATACAQCDRNLDGVIAIDEVQASVNSFLGNSTNCPMVNTPVGGGVTATPTQNPPTATRTATATQTQTATSPPATATPTPPQPSVTPTSATPPLGVRVFTIANDPKSQFLTSVVPGSVSQQPFSTGPIKLSAGVVGPDGTATLQLMEDTVFGWNVLDNSAVCLKLLAAGSTGKIDCDGGAPLDASATLDSKGANPGDPQVITTGIGAASRAGGAYFTATVGYYNAPPISATMPADVSACPQAPFINFQTLPFTTEKVTATVVNPKPGSPGIASGTITLTHTGTPFSCGRFKTTDSAGAFVMPLNAEEQSLGDPNTKFDVAAILFITDN